VRYTKVLISCHFMFQSSLFVCVCACARCRYFHPWWTCLPLCMGMTCHGASPLCNNEKRETISRPSKWNMMRRGSRLQTYPCDQLRTSGHDSGLLLNQTHHYATFSNPSSGLRPGILRLSLLAHATFNGFVLRLLLLRPQVYVWGSSIMKADVKHPRL
jgi:hypothetical protein